MMHRPWCPLALLAVLCALAPATAQAKIGKFDGARVFREYARFTQLQGELRELEKKYQDQVQLRSSQYRLLLDEEWNELMALRAKGEAVTADERTRLQTLQRLSDDRDKERAELEGGGSSMTEAQRTRYRELTMFVQQANAGLEAMATRFGEELQRRVTELNAEIQAAIDAAIAKVAQAEGLELVFAAEAVLYGGVDITDKVLAELNAAAPAPPTPPAQ